MKLMLRVDVEGRFWDGGAVIQVPEMLVEAFEPLKTTDDPWMAMATGDKLENHDSVRRVIKLREKAAEILAKELTHILLSEMRKRDTSNGYPTL